MLRERRLIRRLRERDEDAFREVIKVYQQRVYNIIFRMLGNREESEDLAQEVFETVFKSIDHFRGESKLSTWIYRIAVNHSKNRCKYLARRQYHRAQVLDEASEKGAAGKDGGPVISLQAHISEPDKLLMGLELEEAIQREIAALDEEQRALIVLRDIQGMSYQDIATITSLPEGTVKSRLHRARMLLKDRLKTYM